MNKIVGNHAHHAKRVGDALAALGSRFHSSIRDAYGVGPGQLGRQGVYLLASIMQHALKDDFTCFYIVNGGKKAYGLVTLKGGKSFLVDPAHEGGIKVIPPGPSKEILFWSKIHIGSEPVFPTREEAGKACVLVSDLAPEFKRRLNSAKPASELM